MPVQKKFENYYRHHKMKTNPYQGVPPTKERQEVAISPWETVVAILRANEYSRELEDDSTVSSYSTNLFAANNPIEDRSAEARLLSTPGSLFGVYDGHAGHKCASVLSRTLFTYIATALLPEKKRDAHYYSRKPGGQWLIEAYRDITHHSPLDENEEKTYDDLRMDWLGILKRTRQNLNPRDSLSKGFLRMDADLGRAAESAGLLEATMSGAVACVALIQGRDVFVAGAGDCAAVLGRQDNNGRWTAVKMSTAHTASNVKEVERLRGLHPPEEKKNILQHGRLFGSLMPLRAFGDFRYKWPIATLERVAVPTHGRHLISANYRTPPYLTAEPEVIHAVLNENDKFLVLATDGLWDVLSPEMVVQLIGDYITQSSTKLMLRRSYYEEIFPRSCSQEGIIMRPMDRSETPSTYLLRAALGGSLELVTRQLAVPVGEARNIRDDITVTVIHFKSDSLNPSSEGLKKEDVTDSINQKVSELDGSSDGGSMAHSAAHWEDIESSTGRNDVVSDGRTTERVNLDDAIFSGGIVGSRGLKTNDENAKKRDKTTISNDSKNKQQ